MAYKMHLLSNTAILDIYVEFQTGRNIFYNHHLDFVSLAMCVLFFVVWLSKRDMMIYLKLKLQILVYVEFGSGNIWVTCKCSYAMFH